MGQRSNVDNLCYCDTGAMDCAHCRFTTVTRAFEICLYFAEAEVVGYLGAILSCHLGCIRSVLLAAAEAHLAGRRPGDYLAFAVG